MTTPEILAAAAIAAVFLLALIRILSRRGFPPSSGGEKRAPNRRVVGRGTWPTQPSGNPNQKPGVKRLRRRGRN